MVYRILLAASMIGLISLSSIRPSQATQLTLQTQLIQIVSWVHGGLFDFKQSDHDTELTSDDILPGNPFLDLFESQQVCSTGPVSGGGSVNLLTGLVRIFGNSSSAECNGIPEFQSYAQVTGVLEDIIHPVGSSAGQSATMFTHIKGDLNNGSPPGVIPPFVWVSSVALGSKLNRCIDRFEVV